MQSLKEREYQLVLEERKWEKEKEILTREKRLKQEKKAIMDSQKEKIPTSKKLVWFLFLNCTIIELVTIVITFNSFDLAMCIGIAPDFTPLVTLIGTIVSEVIGFAVYAVKSAKENTKGGITYDMAMSNLNTPSTNTNADNNSVG